MENEVKMPQFKNESDEADWWASEEGREFVRQKSEISERGKQLKGSRLVEGLRKANTVQIALRLPQSDLAEARKIATRKGIGYQTLLKMILHEGLEREARR